MANKSKAIALITTIRNSDGYIKAIYEQGGCYQFYLILKTVFPDAIPLMNHGKNHIVTQIDDAFFDITGEVFGDYFEMNEVDFEVAKSWSFSKNYALSSGVCEFCGEPSLITLAGKKND